MESELNSLANFQAHSRLHFIGQWKTKAEDICSTIYEQEHPEWCHGTLAQQSLFIHIDMDAFFCSAVLSKPEYAKFRDKPVAVATGRINSDISSCNYIARSFGVHAGMWVKQAKEMCPDLITLPYDLARCEALNKLIYRLLLQQCPVGVQMAMEVYSVDDMMVAFDRHDYLAAREYCERIRAEICAVTDGCTASCGIADTILVARLATAAAKPNGVKCVERHEVQDFMRTVCIKDLHGIGRAARRKLAPLLLSRAAAAARSGETSKEANGPGLVCDPRGGLTDDQDDQLSQSSEEGAVKDDDVAVGCLSCSALQQVAKSTLLCVLGAKNGELLYNHCRGIDHRVVRRTGDKADQALLGKGIPKVVGCSMNYAVRPLSTDDVDSLLRQILADVLAKLRRHAATTSSLRVGILERHPAYPKSTTKFNGCGRCVEHFISVPLPRPLSGEQGFELEQHILACVRPRLRLVRSISDDERLKRINACGDVLDRRDPINQFQVLKKEGTKAEIQIDDIRGISITANGLAVVSYRANASHMLSKVQRLKPSTSSRQVTLTAAFAKVSEVQRSAPTEVLTLTCSSESSVEEIDVLSSLTPDVVHDDPQRRMGCKRARETIADEGGELLFHRLRSEFPIRSAGAISVADVTSAVRWCLANDSIASVKSLMRQIVCAVESDSQENFTALQNAVDAEITRWLNRALPSEKRRPFWQLELS